VVERSLSIRSRKLLKRPRLSMAPKAETEIPIQYVERPDPATYCKTLYAPCYSSSDESSEEEADRPREIRTNKIGGSGEDLTDGILAVDGVRFLSNNVRKVVKDIKYLDLNDGLLAFIDGRRTYLNRKLQYFVNMVLLPHVGYQRERIRVIFEDCWLEPREFTVNVSAKEKRGYKKDSNYFLRSLREVTEDITNTLVGIMDFVKAVEGLKVIDEDYHLLLPVFS
jgi:hypothetical protein